jgi:hypothetical protein
VEVEPVEEVVEPTGDGDGTETEVVDEELVADDGGD